MNGPRNSQARLQVFGAFAVTARHPRLDFTPHGLIRYITLGSYDPDAISTHCLPLVDLR